MSWCRNPAAETRPRCCRAARQQRPGRRRRECGRGGDLAAAGAGSPRPRRLPHVRTSRFSACRRSARCSSCGARRTAKRLIGDWRNPPGAGPTAAEMGPKCTGRRGPARGRRRPRRASRPRAVPGAAAVRAGWRGQRCRKLAPRREAGRPCQGARPSLGQVGATDEERSQFGARNPSQKLTLRNRPTYSCIHSRSAAPLGAAGCVGW